MVFGAHNDGRALSVGHSPPLGPPFSWLFLAHIGRANDVPGDAVTSSSGASRAVQQPASVVSTPAPTSGCRHRTRHRLSRPSRLIHGSFRTSTHFRIMNGARPSVSAGN